MISAASRGFSLFTLLIFCSGSGQLLATPPEKNSLSASRVTLHSPGNQSLAEVVAAITKQTGMELDISGFDETTQTKVDWNDIEFWNALQDLATAVNGRWEMTPKSKMPKLVKATNPQAPKVYVEGPFRIAARDILVRSDLVSGRTFYDLTLEVAWEPADSGVPHR